VKRVPNWVIGLGLVLVLAAASYMAFAKKLPWSHEFTIKAVFSSAQNLRTSSPVRIAGVNVGKVVNVEPLVGAQADEATAQAPGGSDRRAGRDRDDGGAEQRAAAP
jgi:ABC-type transporter Mla subunit MlaD